jgi:MICOS complex subunit MIC19
LERLRQREKQTIEEIEKRVAAELPERKVSGAPALSPSYAAPAGSLNLDAPRIPFAGREHDTPLFPVDPALQEKSPSAPQQPPADVDPSRQSVLNEIERLRGKLESRKKLSALDENVERAKTDVVNCLRINDRRPLDCWKEVDSFKQEVAKLERAFVDKVVG